jgi:hypothetical protein
MSMLLMYIRLSFSWIAIIGFVTDYGNSIKQFLVTLDHIPYELFIPDRFSENAKIPISEFI